MKLSRTAPGPRAPRGGGAMVAALLVVVAVATLSMIHLQLDLSRAREQRATVDTKRAFYMAEAGLAEAFHGLVAGKSGNVGSEDEPARFANGLFFTTAREEGLGRVTLTSTGLCGAGRATLSLVVERVNDSTSARGFFGDVQVTIEPNATIDSYDSRQGTYAGQTGGVLQIGGAQPTGARVGCNGSITVGGASGTTRVYGDARPGPSGIVVQGVNTTITGSTAPFSVPAPMPAIPVPSYPSLGSVQTSLLAPQVRLPAGEHSYTELRAGAAGKITVCGPARLVVERLRVDPTGTLAFDTSNGPIRIVVTDWLDLESGALIASGTADPRSVSLAVTSTTTVDRNGDRVADPPVVLKATGSFVGTLYAPGASVTVPATMPVFGALCARTLTLKAGGKLHFDRSLDQSGAEDEDGLPELVGWRLVELPNVPIVKLRYDALRELVNTGVVPVDSSDAHYAIGDAP